MKRRPRIDHEQVFAERERQAIAEATPLVKRPWRPIKTAPKDGREFLGLWVDIDGTWNVDLIAWNDSAEQFDRHGAGVYALVGWMPRPPLPGPARIP